MINSADLPDDIELLKAIVLRQQDQNARLEKLVTDFKRALFGFFHINCIFPLAGGTHSKMIHARMEALATAKSRRLTGHKFLSTELGNNFYPATKR